MQTEKGKKQSRMPRWWLLAMLVLLVALATAVHILEQRQRAAEAAIYEETPEAAPVDSEFGDRSGMVTEKDEVRRMIREGVESVPEEYAKKMIRHGQR